MDFLNPRGLDRLRNEIEMNGDEEKFRSGYVAIIGKPNVGKSTLLNGLLDFKLSIVSPKPQTTRHRVLGILTEKNAQIVFLDTPGLIKPKYALHSAMMKTANLAIESADILLVMVDVTDVDAMEFITQLFGTTLKSSDLPKILLLNKIDLMAKESLLPMIEVCHRMNLFKEIIPISALGNDGIDRVKNALIARLPEGGPFFPEDSLTEQPEKFFVSEIIREKIFLNYEKEIPYSTDVQIEEFREEEGRKDFIRAVILVERPSQKAILIGKKGAALKRIGEAARKDIEQFLDRKVFLELWVKVKTDWRQDKNTLKDLGYL